MVLEEIVCSLYLGLGAFFNTDLGKDSDAIGQG